MGKNKKTLLVAALTGMLSLSAHAEMFPEDGPSFRLTDEYSTNRNYKYRYGENGKELTEQQRKRRAVEEYMDNARRSRGVSEKSYRGRPRPRAMADRPQGDPGLSPGGRPYARSGMNRAPAYDSAPVYYRDDAANGYGDGYEAPQAYPPRRDNRGYAGKPAPRNNYQQDNYARSYQGAPAYESQNFWSARPAPNPTVEPENNSRKELLRVKQWMRDQDDRERRVASLDRDGGRYRSTAEMEEPGLEFKGLNVRLGVAGGLSTVSSSNETAQTQRESQELGDNFYLGFFGDVSAWDYFGAEADIFFGIAPQITILDAENGNSQQMKSLQHKGMMFEAKIQAPFDLDGGYRLTPKLGIGFGSLGLSESVETTESSQQNSLGVSGMYFSFGLEAKLTSTISLGIDYASSLAASAGIESNQSFQPVDGSGFSRMRVGAYLQVTPSISMGAQFIQRNLNIGTGSLVPTNASGTESLNQMLGVLMLRL